jgi:SM-20-related protein
LAFYPGNQQASYTRHLDTCIATIYELGLLEWWRLSDYRHRVVTVILYLNDPDRSTDDGGALRCWIKQPRNNKNNKNNKNNNHQDNDEGDESSFDITPKGGTMVIFQSDLVEHMVLPSTVDRYALTNWISETTQ